MRVIIDFVPHNKQRYDTVGDWFWKGQTLHIKVSRLRSWTSSFYVAIHEFFEAMWCKYWNVKQAAVDKFDMEYEKNRKEGDNSESGDDPAAPYYWGHQGGSVIEKIASLWLENYGDKWRRYDAEVRNL